MTKTVPLTEVVAAAIEAGGGLGEVAKKVGVKSPSLFKWRAAGRVPAERVLAMEEATGVSRHDLRPDIYPRETLVRAICRGDTSVNCAEDRTMNTDTEIAAVTPEHVADLIDAHLAGRM